MSKSFICKSCNEINSFSIGRTYRETTTQQGNQWIIEILDCVELGVWCSHCGERATGNQEQALIDSEKQSHTRETPRQIEEWEADALTKAGHLIPDSVGAENTYYVNAAGVEFYCKNYPRAEDWPEAYSSQEGHPKPRVIVLIEGGLCSGVNATVPGIDVQLLDLDCYESDYDEEEIQARRDLEQEFYSMPFAYF